MIKIKREMLSSQVYGALKEMIANYRFTPGSRLNVEQLAKDFGVSRTPVWEAVRRLEQEGLLVNIPNRGVFMVEMTHQMALEIYQVREVLEGLAARLAVLNSDKKIMGDMEEILSQQRKTVDEGNLIAYSKLDFKFHAIIYRMSGNQFLQEMLESLKTKMRPFVLLRKPLLAQLYADHLEFMEAIRAGDPERGEAAFFRHNRKMQNHIRKEVEKKASGTETEQTAV